MTHWVMNQEGVLVNLEKVSAIFIESQIYQYGQETFRVMCDGDSFDYTLQRFDSSEEAVEFMDELLEMLEK